MDPGVLRDFSNEGIEQRTTHRLRIDGREVRFGQESAHEPRGPAGIDQVVNDQYAFAATTARRHDIERYALDETDVAPPRMLVARDTNRIYKADAKFARHDRGRNEAAARYADNDVERPLIRQARRERARIAVQFVPGQRDSPRRLLMLRLRGRPTGHYLSFTASAQVEHDVKPRVKF